MLRPEQRSQIDKQIAAYEKMGERSDVTIHLPNIQFPLVVHKYVAHPEIMNSGVELVDYLSNNPELVRGKVVTDMGTGSGIIGISAGLLGANKVYMPEVDPHAVLNAKENVALNHLSDRCEVFESDLFSKYDEREASDVQIFNHPFFSNAPEKTRQWTRMMLGGIDLLGRYLQDAPAYSKKNTIYLFPWLTLASSDDYLDNDPGKRASQYGYEVLDEIIKNPIGKGLQATQFKIYLLQYVQKL